MTILLLILSVVHFPIIIFGDDSIGLFDIVFTLIFIYNLFFIRKILEVPIIFTYLIFIYFCILSTIIIIDYNLNFQILFILKQIQYLLIATVWYIHLSKSDNFDNFILGIFLVSFIVSFYGFYSIFSGQCMRLTLINKFGCSPNPSSFILSICIISIFYYGLPYQRYLMVIPIIALALTFSRTNGLALVLTFIFWIIIRSNLTKIVLSISSIFIVLSIFSIIYHNLIPPEYLYHKSILFYLLNPVEIIQDPSFQLRLSTWNSEFSNDFIKLIVGKGIGLIEIADSLFIKLFSGSGIFGFLSYIILILLFAFRSKPLLILSFFILLNGISTETTLNSYRCMQILIPILMFLILKDRKEKLNDQNIC